MCIARLSIAVIVGALGSTTTQSAQPPPWEAPSFDAAGNPKEIGRYLRELRTSSQAYLDKVNGAETLTRESILAPKIDEALAQISPIHLEEVMAACIAAEAAVPVKSVDVYADIDGRREFIGYDEVKPAARTLFTRRVLRRLLTAPDIPTDRRKSIFTRIAVLPELILILRANSWDQEADPFLKVAVFRKIDTETGWWGTQAGWLDYLIRINSRNSWSILEHLLIYGSPSVKTLTFSAVRALPAAPLDLNAAVKKAWAAEHRRDGQPETYAPIAASFGHTNALILLAEKLGDPKTTSEQVTRFGRALVNALEPQFPSVKEAATFVTTQRQRLIFDPVIRKYRADAKLK